jgi:hypothetical protein
MSASVVVHERPSAKRREQDRACRYRHDQELAEVGAQEPLEDVSGRNFEAKPSTKSLFEYAPGSQATRCWRRQSRANPSLKPKFPASRERTGNFIDSGLGRVNSRKNEHHINILRANSLRIRTGNFVRPCREFKSASREISARISEFRSRPLFWPTNSGSPREISNVADKEKAARYISRAKTHGPRHPTDLAWRPARA